MFKYLNLALILADRFSLAISSYEIDEGCREYVKDWKVRIGAVSWRRHVVLLEWIPGS